MSFGIILCEGFYDRAFWSGLCERRGWTSDKSAGQRHKVTGGGQYFFAKAGQGIVIKPVNGDGQLTASLRTLINGRATKPYPWILLNCDSDGQEGSAEGIVRGVASSLGLDEAERARLFPFAWTSPSLDGAPNDDLERLIRHAFARAQGPRDAAVRAWLSGPELQVPERVASKAHVYSLMAGWAADRGCENFYQAVWQEPAVATELEALLAASPRWDGVEWCLAG